MQSVRRSVVYSIIAVCGLTCSRCGKKEPSYGWSKLRENGYVGQAGALGALRGKTANELVEKLGQPDEVADLEDGVRQHKYQSPIRTEGPWGNQYQTTLVVWVRNGRGYDILVSKKAVKYGHRAFEVPEFALVTELMVNGKLIKAGMTYEAVVGLLGEPNSTKRGLGPDHSKVLVVYYGKTDDDYKKFFHLEFDDGLEGELSRMWYNYGY